MEQYILKKNLRRSQEKFQNQIGCPSQISVNFCLWDTSKETGTTDNNPSPPPP